MKKLILACLTVVALSTALVSCTKGSNSTLTPSTAATTSLILSRGNNDNVSISINDKTGQINHSGTSYVCNDVKTGKDGTQVTKTFSIQPNTSSVSFGTGTLIVTYDATKTTIQSATLTIAGTGDLNGTYIN